MAKKKTSRGTKTRKADDSIPNDTDLLRYLNLDLIRTIETSSKLRIENNALPDDDMSVSVEIQPYRVNDQHLNVNVIAKLETRPSTDGKLQSSVTFFCAMQCLFTSEKRLPLTDAPLAAAESLIISCRMMVWPYIRQFVHTSSLNMGLPPIILPMAFNNPQITHDSERAE